MITNHIILSFYRAIYSWNPQPQQDLKKRIQNRKKLYFAHGKWSLPVFHIYIINKFRNYFSRSCKATSIKVQRNSHMYHGYAAELIMTAIMTVDIVSINEPPPNKFSVPCIVQ